MSTGRSRLYRELAPDLLTYLIVGGATDPAAAMVAAFGSIADPDDDRGETLPQARRRLYRAARQHLTAPSTANDGAATSDHLPFAELGQLEAPHRELLLLRYVVDLETDDLVEILDRPAEAVQDLEREALIALRRLLPATDHDSQPDPLGCASASG